MRREDCVDMFKKIPVAMHPQTVLTLRNGMALTVDVAVRFEPAYLVMRGREGGTTDEGRAFFVPYEDVSYIKVDRVVKVGDLRRMYGETGFIDDEDKLGAAAAEEQARNELARTPAPTEADTRTPPPTPAPLLDPAAIAKQNLLDRIRAARTGAMGGKK